MASKDFQEIIPVFLASDENYAPFLAVAMFSILKNTKSFIEFYILDGGIKDNSRKKIEKTLDNFKHKNITYFDMKKFPIDKFPNLKHYSINTFSRYFIPEILKTAGKVIYLDVDTILKGDISSLFNINLENFPLGAVCEDFYEKNGDYLKANIYPSFLNPKNYFNAGVLILDIQKFIENNYSKILIEKTMEYADKLNCADQDIFNIVFENNYKKLDYKYNFIPDFYESYGNISPLIIHYAGKKPWKSLSESYSKEFFRYSDKTAFALEIRLILFKNFIKEIFKNIKSFLYRKIKMPLMKLFFNK